MGANKSFFKISRLPLLFTYSDPIALQWKMSEKSLERVLRTKLTDFSVQIGVKITHFPGRLAFNELLRFFTENALTITDRSCFQPGEPGINEPFDKDFEKFSLIFRKNLVTSGRSELFLN